MSARLRATLLQHRRLRWVDPINLKAHDLDHDLVFTTRRDGKPLDESRVRKAFAGILKAAWLPPHHTPHGLRHTFCTLLLAAGVPVTYVMSQAGHSSIDVTVRNYGRWIPKTDKTLVDRIPDALERLSPKAVADNG